MEQTAEGQNLLAATLIDTVKADNEEKVKEMLEADPALARARDADGVSALLWSIYSNNKAITAMLIEYAAPLDIFDASASGQLARVEALLVSAPAQEFSADGWTPLHLAAAFGHVDVVTALLNHGAELETRSNNYMKNTPLSACVAISRSRAVAQELLQHGANVNAAQVGGMTPLHQAAAQGDVEMCRLLLDRGADLNARSVDGKTALDLAREKEQGEAVDMLLQATRARSS